MVEGSSGDRLGPLTTDAPGRSCRANSLMVMDVPESARSGEPPRSAATVSQMQEARRCAHFLARPSPSSCLRGSSGPAHRLSAPPICLRCFLPPSVISTRRPSRKPLLLSRRASPTAQRSTLSPKPSAISKKRLHLLKLSAYRKPLCFLNPAAKELHPPPHGGSCKWHSTKIQTRSSAF